MEKEREREHYRSLASERKKKMESPLVKTSTRLPRPLLDLFSPPSLSVHPVFPRGFLSTTVSVSRCRSPRFFSLCSVVDLVVVVFSSLSPPPLYSSSKKRTNNSAQSFSMLYPSPVWLPSKCTARAWYFLRAGLCATESVVIPASAAAA